MRATFARRKQSKKTPSEGNKCPDHRRAGVAGRTAPVPPTHRRKVGLDPQNLPQLPLQHRTDGWAPGQTHDDHTGCRHFSHSPESEQHTELMKTLPPDAGGHAEEVQFL